MSELGERMIPVPPNDAGRGGKLLVFTRNPEALENSESLSAKEYYNHYKIAPARLTTKLGLRLSSGLGYGYDDNLPTMAPYRHDNFALLVLYQVRWARDIVRINSSISPFSDIPPLLPLSD